MLTAEAGQAACRGKRTHILEAAQPGAVGALVALQELLAGAAARMQPLAVVAGQVPANDEVGERHCARTVQAWGGADGEGKSGR